MRVLLLNSRILQLVLVFLLIVCIYTSYTMAPLFIIPFILVSYFRLLIYKDLSDVLVLILMARCVMGFTVPTNSIVFNIMNAVCNYIPIFLYIYLRPIHFRKPNYELISKYKWTLVYTAA